MPIRAEDRDEARAIAQRIGAGVRDARRAAHLTQEELSERVRITSEALGRIERGAALPSWPTFLRLCGAISLSADALLIGKPGEAPRPTIRDPADREVSKLGLYVRRLDVRSRRALLGVARALAALAGKRPQRVGRRPRRAR